VFKLSQTASGWKETILHAFTGTPDGSTPIGSLAFDAAGNLYGTTMQGCDAGCEEKFGCGTAFEITP
jgi:hypothetical protein